MAWLIFYVRLAEPSLECQANKGRRCFMYILKKDDFIGELCEAMKRRNAAFYNKTLHFFGLDYQDSNLDKQNQNLLCYHYTIVQ